jgi:dihydrofolate reductase
MRKVILQEFVTLDGLAAGRSDSVDFVPASTQGDQSFGRQQLAFMDSIDRILLGRVTYTMFAGYWPEVTSGEDKPFADKLNAIPKIVFSRSLDRAPWGKWDDATIVKSSAAKEVAKLKQGSGKDMVIWGSISLAQSLTSEGLIDEYQLIVCPVVLGSGKPLFRDKADSFEMRLLRTTSFDRGTVLLAYTAARGRSDAANTSDHVAASHSKPTDECECRNDRERRGGFG